MSDLAKYLAGLKAGDVVTVRWVGGQSQELPVERVTPTQILVAGRRFCRTHKLSWQVGTQITANYRGAHLLTPNQAENWRKTDAKRAAIKDARAKLIGLHVVPLELIPAAIDALLNLEQLLKEDADND